MPGRIESYLHSDLTTKNKHGSLVKVECETDFGARSEEFIRLCKRIAMYACGSQTCDIDAVFATFPYLEDDLKETSNKLKENIKVTDVYIMQI